MLVAARRRGPRKRLVQPVKVSTQLEKSALDRLAAYCEVRRDGRTQEVQSVRVVTAKSKRGLWVQPQYLTRAGGSDDEKEMPANSPAL